MGAVTLPKVLPTATVTCREQYRQALTFLMQKEPFYYHFIAQLRYVEVESGIPLAAIAYQNGTFLLILNKKTFPTLELEKAAGVLTHELMHFIFQHLASPFLMQNKDVWNWATDLAINTLIPYAMPDGVLFPDKVKEMLKIEEDFPPQKAALFYYSILLKYQDQIKERTGDGEGQFSFEAHDGWGNLSKEEQKTATYRLARMAKNAADKSNGRMPGTIKGDIESLMKALESKVDWRRELRAWVGRCGDFEIAVTNARPNKYGNYPRTVFLPGARVLIAIDTSGSVNDKLLQQFLGEMVAVAKYKLVDVMFVDWDVHEVKPFKRRADGMYSVKGRGGTDMRKIFDYVEEKGLQYDGIIVCTDMETPFPTHEQVRKIGARVLWVNGGHSEYAKQIPPGIGKVLNLWDLEADD